MAPADSLPEGDGEAEGGRCAVGLPNTPPHLSSHTYTSSVLTGVPDAATSLSFLPRH